MIVLARHGETDFNREGRVQGRTDVPLNEAGRRQARMLAGEVAASAERWRAIYTSHLARALETAEVLAAELGLEPVVDERFAETDRGRWEGRTWESLAAEEPDAYAAWQAAGDGFRFPGGESLGEQMDRVVAALSEIEHGGGPLPAVVVCHGGSIRVALCHARERGLEAFHKWDVPNGALIRL